MIDCAMVIGTHGTPQYVHLHLETRKRYYADVPCLIHDDCSTEGERLAALAREYGADYVSTAKRRGHLAGDLAAFVSGFDWCTAPLLVKMSRRYIPLGDWRKTLAVAMTAPAPMYAARGLITGPIRTDCIAFDVAEWGASGRVEELRGTDDQAEFLLWRLCRFSQWDTSNALGFQLRNDYLSRAREYGLPYSAEDYLRHKV